MIDYMAILESTARSAEYNYSIKPGGYVIDGLLHCQNCKMPKQCRVKFTDGIEKIVYCLCACGMEAEQKREQREAEQRDQCRIARLKAKGIQDREICNWTFANDDRRNPPMSDKAMRYYAKWRQMHEQNIGLLLWGNVGAGKSYFAACVANGLIDNGVPVLMTNFTRIVNAMTGFENKEKNVYIDSFNDYKLLVIDDLGAERQTDFAQEIVYQTIDGRYKNGQPVVITTNLSLDEIKNPQNITCRRIYDRILEMCVPIEFKGESRRRAIYANKIKQARALFEADEAISSTAKGMGA